MLFTGSHEHRIDAKNRLAIPAEIRGQWRLEEHGAAWYAVPWIGGRVRLYTEADFRARAREYSLGLTPDQDEAELHATLFGLSARLEMDSAGRIRVPDDIMELVGLGSEVALVGAGDWLEIRDRDSWRAEKRQRLEQLPDLMARTERKRALRESKEG